MVDAQSNEAMREVGQGRLPGGGRSDTGADLEGCLGIPQKESRKGHSGQEGEDRHRPVSERRQVGGWLKSRGGARMPPERQALYTSLDQAPLLPHFS